MKKDLKNKIDVSSMNDAVACIQSVCKNVRRDCNDIRNTFADEKACFLAMANVAKICGETELANQLTKVANFMGETSKTLQFITATLMAIGKQSSEVKL